MGNLYDDVLALSDKGTLMVFGTSRTCKSKFALMVLDAYLAKNERRALYIDTERNLHDDEVPSGNVDYVVERSFDGIYDKITSLSKDYGLIILDSFGAPMLGRYGELSMNEKGQVLLKGQVISYKLGTYAQKHNALVLVINQPVSEFNKSAGEVLWPFGDKAIFFFQEVWRTVTVTTEPNRTVAYVTAFGSRMFGMNTRLFKITVTPDEITCEKIYKPPSKRRFVYKG